MDDTIRAQVFNSDGTKSGEEFLVNLYGYISYGSLSVSTLKGDRFEINWVDFEPVNFGSVINGQIFDPRDTAVSLTGSTLGDDFIGTRFGDTIFGKNGDDTLRGLAGADTLRGDNGNDTLIGDYGADHLFGGAGRDKLFGGVGDDRLFGGMSIDTLFGGKGRDTVFGGGGNDKLLGGAGRDKLFGGNGADKITGGKGRDEQSGGLGADRFIFKSLGDTGKTVATRDVIKDFSQTQGDRIDLSGIDAKSGGGNQAFTFIGDLGFSGAKGELRYKQVGGKTIVQGDLDGDGIKDFEIELSGVLNLTAGDFLL